MDTNTDISKEKDWLSGNAKKLQLHADEKLKNGFWTFLLQLALSDESPLQVLMWRENPTQLSLLERMERCIWKSNKPRHFFLNSLCLILSLCVNQGPKWVDSFEKTLQQNKDHFFSLCGDLCQSLDFFFEEGICFGETSKITLSEKQRDKLFDGMRKRLRERNSLQAIQSVAKESFLKLLDNSARQMMLRILLYVSKVGGVDEHTIEVIQPLFRKTANDEVVKYIVQANNQLHGQESNRACFCFLIKEQQKKVRFRLPSDFRYCKRAKPSQQTTSSTLTTITGQSFNSNRDPRYSPNYNPHYHPPDPYYYPPDPYYHPPDPHYHPPDRYTIYSPHYYPSQPSTFYRLRSFIHRKIREPEDTQFSLEAPEQNTTMIVNKRGNIYGCVIIEDGGNVRQPNPSLRPAPSPPLSNHPPSGLQVQQGYHSVPPPKPKNPPVNIPAYSLTSISGNSGRQNFVSGKGNARRDEKATHK